MSDSAPTLRIELDWEPSAGAEAEVDELCSLTARGGRVVLRVGSASFEQGVRFALSFWLPDVLASVESLYGDRPDLGRIILHESLSLLSFTRGEDESTVLLATAPERQPGDAPTVSLDRDAFASALVGLWADVLERAARAAPRSLAGEDADDLRDEVARLLEVIDAGSTVAAAARRLQRSLGSGRRRAGPDAR